MPLSGEPMLKNRNRHDDIRMEHTDFESIAIILIELSLSGESACFQSLQSCFLFQVNRKKKTIVARCFSYASMHSACSPLSGEPALKSIRMTLWNYVNSGWCRCYLIHGCFPGSFGMKIFRIFHTGNPCISTLV